MILSCDVAPIILSGVILKYFSKSVMIAIILCSLLIAINNLLALVQIFFPMFNVKIFPEAEDVKMNKGLIISSTVITGAIMLLEYKILC